MKPARKAGGRSGLKYHAQMFAIAVLCGVALLAAIVGFIWLMLTLGVWHIEDR